MVEVTNCYVDVTFIDMRKQEARAVSVPKPTTAGPHAGELRFRCLEHAVDYGYDRWVQPGDVDPAQRARRWWVYRNDRHRQAQFLKAFEPDQLEAATMWALHVRGE